jgi:muconolactone delta-isomerase
MELLAEFDVHVPECTPEAEVEQRVSAEAVASAELAREGHLVRLWRPPVAPGERKALGLYRADSEAQLDGVLGALPLNGWMQISVTPLEPHRMTPTSLQTRLFQLPDPHLTRVYRLDARLWESRSISQGGGQRAGEIEAANSLRPGLGGDQPVREYGDHEPDRDVDEQDPPPPQKVGENAAGQHARRAAGTLHRAPEVHRPVAGGSLLERRGQDRERR